MLQNYPCRENSKIWFHSLPLFIRRPISDVLRKLLLGNFSMLLLSWKICLNSQWIHLRCSNFCLLILGTNFWVVSTLMSVSDGLVPFNCRRKMEGTRPMRKEMNMTVLISRQSRLFPFIVIMTKTLFPIRILTWPLNIYVSRQGRGVKRREESEITISNIIIGINTLEIQLTKIDWKLVFYQRRNYILLHSRIHSKNKRIIQCSQLLSFFLSEGWQHWETNES